jgi:predicted transcriptional regulator
MQTPTIDQAIDALRKLSPERQQELAGYICHLAVEDREPEDIDPAHLPAVLEGLAQIRRGDIATPEQVEAAFRSFDE